MTFDPQAQSHFDAGVRHWQAGAADAAIASFRAALRLDPRLAPAQVNLGMLLEDRGEIDAALDAYRNAIALDPGVFQAHLNLGALLAARKRFDEAEAAYLAALACDPAAPAGWSNLGVLYACTGREAPAEHCYRQAIALDPGYALARFNLAYVLLRQARFDEGWAMLEARAWADAMAPRMPCPRWDGEPLDARAILIVHEGGHGDMLQFCRYASVLKSHGARRVGLVCHPALAELLRSLDGVDEILPLDQPMPASGWDLWVSLLSLPHRCGTRLDSIPASVPYLRAEPARVARWREHLSPDGRLRVGLVWRGNPAFENDADRSLPTLDMLAPLAAIAGVRWFSLQVGAGSDEARHPPAGLAIEPLGDALTDFADTAAAIAQLDLVITVDTAAAHLAGALGRPCWVLLPAFKPDWRWLADRSDSPWYPGVMRLFRQARMGDWTPTIAAVAQALGQHTAPRR